MFVNKHFGGNVKQKKAIYVTLTILALTILENQLIWYGWGGPFQGFGGLILSGALAAILVVVLVIQLIAYLITRSSSKARKTK